MKKHNLVLIPGFQTNTIILKELLEYMGHYYNVYFIDLPGFNNSIPAFNEISMRGFIDYIQNEINQLGLESYILGGISFGFVVISNLRLESNCMGILAIEPFLGMESVGIGNIKLQVLKKLESFVNKYELYDLAFSIGKNRAIELLLTGGRDHSAKKIIETTDPRTYFQTVKILFQTNKCEGFKNDLPHVVLMNPKDRTLNYNHIVSTIRNNVKRSKVLNMDMEHFPANLSHSYFSSKLPAKIFEEINTFFVNNEKH